MTRAARKLLRLEPEPADGRRARSVRTRKAIVGALLELVSEGNFEPGASEIAGRAGLAVRSIGQHFASREALFLAAVEEHARRVAPRERVDARMPLRERIAVFAELRGRELEACTGIRRAAALLDPRSGRAGQTAIGRATDAAWQRRRRELAEVFAPELAARADAAALLDMLDLLAHGRTWDTMRLSLKLSPSDAAALLRRTLASLLSQAGAT